MVEEMLSMITTNNGWISVDDAVPPDGRKYLLFLKSTNKVSDIPEFHEMLKDPPIGFHSWVESKEKNIRLKDYIVLDDSSSEKLNKFPGYKVTHWMPLPKYPEKAKV
jgi:hypothetical protein